MVFCFLILQNAPSLARLQHLLLSLQRLFRFDWFCTAVCLPFRLCVCLSFGEILTDCLQGSRSVELS